MREFLSKSIAAGLSTGVVLLWWPVLFDRVGAAHSRLHSGSRRRRMSRLSAVASTAIVVPLVLLVTGLQQAPASARINAAPQHVKIVRVTKVVKVVQHPPVQRPAH